jgi:mannan endo-1,4-beta-mannosidase
MHPTLKLQGILILMGMVLLLFTFSCAQKHSPIATDATGETNMLFKNLEKLSENHTLFGHHNATEYG